MPSRKMFASLLALASLAGCGSPSAVVHGRIDAKKDELSKVGLIRAEGDDERGMLKELARNLNLIERDGTLTFNAVTRPMKDGSYSIELKSSRKSAGFALFAWRDANRNDRIDQAEGLSLAKSTRNNARYYTFLKTVEGIRYGCASGRGEKVCKGYGFAFGGP